MCGIIGQISFNKLFKADCSSALKFLNHRGPDHQNIMNFELSEASVSFGHTRLSILDLTENGNQPMVSFSGKHCIIFNGEIYNYIEIRNELLRIGFDFKSNSDTEVILSAFQYYGNKVCEKLDGMFSFAILDIEDQIIFLGRDRFGKKPLYYYLDEHQFSFASEITSLKNLNGINNNLNISDESIIQFYLFGFIPQPNSIFREIKKIPSGNNAIFNFKYKNKIEIKEYWNPLKYNQDIYSYKSDDENLYYIDKLLDNAVRKRLISDVPICCLLSGGVDSSIVLAKALNLGANLKSYTISFPGYFADESIYAQKVANYLGAQHEIIEMNNDDMTDSARIFLELVDEPIGDAACLPLYFLSKNIASNYKVALGGDGGDEIFGGYTKYIAQQYLYNYPSFSKLLSLAKGIPFIPDSLKRISEGASLKFEERQFLFGSGGFLPSEISNLLNISKNFSPFNDFKIYSKDNSFDPINHSMYLDCKYQLPDWYLAKADRASMFASIELRSPLLDTELSKYMFNINGNIKIRKNIGKFFLKKITENYLPKEMIYRNKLGFSVDFINWTKTNYFNDLLKLKNSKNIINYDWLNKNINQLSPLKKMRIAFMNHYLNKIL